MSNGPTYREVKTGCEGLVHDLQQQRGGPLPVQTKRHHVPLAFNWPGCDRKPLWDATSQHEMASAALRGIRVQTFRVEAEAASRSCRRPSRRQCVLLVTSWSYERKGGLSAASVGIRPTSIHSTPSTRRHRPEVYADRRCTPTGRQLYSSSRVAVKANLQ